MKRRNFLHMAATGASSAALLHASGTGLAQTAQSAPSDSSSCILIVYYSRKGENCPWWRSKPRYWSYGADGSIYC